MKLSEEQIRDLKENFDHKRFDWLSYYGSQEYYQKGMVSVLKSLGVDENQINEISDGFYDWFDWRNDDV